MAIEEIPHNTRASLEKSSAHSVEEYHYFRPSYLGVQGHEIFIKLNHELLQVLCRPLKSIILVVAGVCHNTHVGNWIPSLRGEQILQSYSSRVTPKKWINRVSENQQ